MAWSPDRNALRQRIAVVAGATRGAGRGIAAALGEAGATVICTGRSSRSPESKTRSEYDRPETIEETAELVTSLGGIGIARAVDHLDQAQVRALADGIRAEHGRIDVLVNDIWGAEDLKGGRPWNRPLWEHDLDPGLRLLRLGVETHLITSRYLLPLMVERPGGLLVEVGDGTLAYNTTHYRISAFYGLAKVAVNHLAFSLGHDLEPRGGTAVSLTPGYLRSERMLDAFGVTEATWRTALEPRPKLPRARPEFALSESPRYVGRAVAALAADPDRARWNRRSLTSGELARSYGFSDLDGSQPDIWRYHEDEDAGRAGEFSAYR
jgi:NAD(P)-dependent dehydrogenase (short-subunit alcohol dehydrogenase family)